MKQTRWLVVFLLLVFPPAVSVLAIDTDRMADPQLQARYQALAQELRCLVCQNQSIADSNAELAVDLRRQIRRLLEEGASDRQILDYMTDRYGDYVRYRPPLAPRTLALWFGPLAFLLVGVAVMVPVLRRHRAPVPGPDSGAGTGRESGD